MVGAAIVAMIGQVLSGLLALNLTATRAPGSQHIFYGVLVLFTFAFAYIYRATLRRRPALYIGLLLLFVMGLGIRESRPSAAHSERSGGVEMLLEGKRFAHHRSAHLRLDRLACGPSGAGGGRRDRGHRFREGHENHPTVREAPPDSLPVYELDINEPDHLEALREELDSRWGGLDGALHAIAFAPADSMGGNFLTAPAESAAIAFQTSAFSYKALAVGMLPLFRAAGGGSLVTLDFDNTQAWPAYDWMGVAKAALEAITRYLARDLGRYRVRVNAVSAGPLGTVAAKSIPGFSVFQEVWNDRAPLRWDAADPDPVARDGVSDAL